VNFNTGIAACSQKPLSWLYPLLPYLSCKNRPFQAPHPRTWQELLHAAVIIGQLIWTLVSPLSGRGFFAATQLQVTAMASVKLKGTALQHSFAQGKAGLSALRPETCTYNSSAWGRQGVLSARYLLCIQNC